MMAEHRVFSAVCLVSGLVGHGCAMPIVSCLVARVECHCSCVDFALAPRCRNEVLVRGRSFRVIVAE
jgi:hypothetical protein